MSRSLIVVLLASFFFSSAALAGNCVKQQQDSAKEGGAVDAQPVQAGRMAYIDPETGELTSRRPADMPAPEAASAELQQARRDAEVITHPDGMRSIDVSGLYMSTLEAEIVDGEIVTCHTNNYSGQQK